MLLLNAHSQAPARPLETGSPGLARWRPCSPVLWRDGALRGGPQNPAQVAWCLSSSVSSLLVHTVASLVCPVFPYILCTSWLFSTTFLACLTLQNSYCSDMVVFPQKSRFDISRWRNITLILVFSCYSLWVNMAVNGSEAEVRVLKSANILGKVLTPPTVLKEKTQSILKYQGSQL